VPAQRKTTKNPIALFNPPSHDGGYHSAYPRSRARKGAENKIQTQKKAGSACPTPARSGLGALPTLCVAQLVRARKTGFKPKDQMCRTAFPAHSPVPHLTRDGTRPTLTPRPSSFAFKMRSHEAMRCYQRNKILFG